MALQFFPENGAVTNQRWMFQNRLNALGTKINTLMGAAGQADTSASRWGNLYQYEDTAQNAQTQNSFGRLLGSLDSWRAEKAAKTAAAEAEGGFFNAGSGAGIGALAGLALAPLGPAGAMVGMGAGAAIGGLAGGAVDSSGGGYQGQGQGMLQQGVQQYGQDQRNIAAENAFLGGGWNTTPYTPQSVVPAPQGAPAPSAYWNPPWGQQQGPV